MQNNVNPLQSVIDRRLLIIRASLLVIRALLIMFKSSLEMFPKNLLKIVGNFDRHRHGHKPKLSQQSLLGLCAITLTKYADIDIDNTSLPSSKHRKCYIFIQYLPVQRIVILGIVD